MNKEKTVLLFLLLLNSTLVVAQEDVSEDDLQTLLDEKPSAKEIPSSPVTAPSENAVEATNTTPPASSGASLPPATESVSSETVDLDFSEAPMDEVPAATTEITSEAKPDLAPQAPADDGAEVSADNPLDDETPSVQTAKKEQGDKESTQEADDLENLKADIGDDELKELEDFEPSKAATPDKPEAVPTVVEKPVSEPEVFDAGKEERELLALAQNIQGQISDTEWSEVATAAKQSSYTVAKNDWLFKISKKLFGSGFYYPKIWSLNSFITNPHFIEPGMVLSFTTGNSSDAPQVKLGTFSEDEINATPGSLGNQNPHDLTNFGENATPGWIDEKAKLSKEGVYFQYASDETMEDLTKVSEQALNKEYEHYDPPASEFEKIIPKNYDKDGFDKNSKIFYSFKEGFYLSTFISTNIVQDFGAIVNGPDENIFFTIGDHAYIQLDDSVNAVAGDRFSIYSTGGKVKHTNSDRMGYKYTIIGQVKLLRKIREKWEIEFIEVAGTPQRGDRVTAYTPKIDRITHTYNSRLIEAAVIGTFQPSQSILGFGDVVYIDRGRADGVELGNVFEVFGFKDRLTKRNITDQPTYKTGELTIITLTDNFATAIVSKSSRDFYAGDIAITKTKEAHLREQKAREVKVSGENELVGGKALEELDVELNLENLNDDLLKQADKIQLTEDELAELERQEREKSVIKDSERDLKALERLENEIENAETILNDAKLDEDKLLENENLNEIEKKQGTDQESLDEIEENLGKRYIDEDLNSKDNPFGLTEFDVEEIDELLNTEKKKD